MIEGFCLVGPHRVGKSTIAKKVAEKLGIKFVPTSATKVFEDMGLDPRDVLSFEDRLKVQREILRRSCELWGTQTEPWITDRSPIDYMAYMVNDSYPLEDDLYDQWNMFYDNCVDEHACFFKHTFLVEPDGVLESGNEPYKGRASRILQECMNLSYLGILNSNFYDSEFTIIHRGWDREGKVLRVCDILKTLKARKEFGNEF